MSANKNQRPKFYEEQFLGEADMTAAVDYSRAQQARHALGAHTWGIAAGLQLTEKDSPNGGGQVDVYLQPGLAWDGFGRALLVPSPYKIPSELFKAIVFDNAIDGGAPPGRLLKVWLRYVESDSRQAGPGFAACDAEDQFSRTQETFRVEVGERLGNAIHDQITIGDYTIDATGAAQKFDPQTPPTVLFDETVAYQDLPLDNARARWLILLGEVRWLPNQVASQAGNFVKRNADDLKHSRSLRRYVGVVAESVHAAEDHIRLRQRTKDYSTVVSDDLVWVEGKLRVEGDARLFGGALDFRDQQGHNFDIPLAVRRTGDGSLDGSLGGRALQMVIGQDSQPNNRLAVGPLKTNGSVDEKFVVLSNGNIGIGTATPTQMLTFAVPEGNRLEIGKTSPTLPWSPATPARAGAFVINQQSQGSAEPGADFALMRDRKKRLTLLDSDTNLSSQGGGSLRFFINYDEPSGSQEAMTVSGLGRVGIGTTNPTHRFHVLAQNEVGLFESSGDQAFLRLMTSEGFDKRVEITNRPGGRFSVWTLGGGDSFNVNQAGKVGIGTTAPMTKLHVLGNRIRLENSDKRVDLRADGSSVDLHSETNDLYVRSSGPDGNNNVIINPFAADGNVGIGIEEPISKLHVMGDLRITGTARKPGGGPWADSGSDKRLKKEVATLTDALGKLLQLRGVSFFWKEPEKMGNLTGPQMGFIAQEVEQVFPEWVSDGPEGHKELAVRGFEALTIEALRELKDEIDRLKATSSKARTRRATPK